MAEFKKNKKLKGILFSKVTLLVLFVFSVILIILLIDIIPKEISTRRNKQTVLDQLNSLKNQSLALGSQIEKLKTNDGLEEKIREKFRVVKEGERLIVIVDDQNSSNVALTPKTASFWNFLKNLFR